MNDKAQLKTQILDTTIHIFNKKGLKFTLDDIASLQGISKKTIYTVFNSKEDLFLTMVDYIFDSIKESEQRIIDDETMTTEAKIRSILTVLPEAYKDVNFQELYVLKNKYPKTYQKVEMRLETGWESTIGLLEQGMEEGVIRSFNIPILKTMFEASIEQFFKRDVLVKNNICYNDALDEVVDILMDGIVRIR